MRALSRLAMAMVVALAATTVVAAERIAILDYCDPTDPGWAPTGGCLLKEGDVTFAEFNALLDSVLSTAVVGHPAWRFEPSFAEAEPRETVRAINLGGRNHTFTEVAQFGGGIIPPLNKGLVEAPECVTATVIPPGGDQVIRGLAEGDHQFQCCIHPWMRALIKVEAKQEE
jgi:plastocyanin